MWGSGGHLGTGGAAPAGAGGVQLNASGGERAWWDDLPVAEHVGGAGGATGSEEELSLAACVEDDNHLLRCVAESINAPNNSTGHVAITWCECISQWWQDRYSCSDVCARDNSDFVCLQDFDFEGTICGLEGTPWDGTPLN